MLKIRRYDGRVIGEATRDTIFVDKKPCHFMIKFQGFGLADDILQRLYFTHGITYVVFRYHGKKLILYKVPVKDMKVMGKYAI